MEVFAGGGSRPAVVVGGRVFTDISNLKILKTTVQINSYSVFYDASTATGTVRGPYSVPVGKTFILHALRVEMIDSATNVNGVGIFYADASLGVNSAAAPTNPVGMISGAAVVTNAADEISSANYTGSNIKELAVGGSVPAGKFPHSADLSAGNAASHIITLYGYEV